MVEGKYEEKVFFFFCLGGEFASGCVPKAGTAGTYVLPYRSTVDNQVHDIMAGATYNIG